MDAIDLELAAILNGEPATIPEGDVLVDEPTELDAGPQRTGPVLCGQQAQGDVLVIPRDPYTYPHHADQPLAHDTVIVLIADGNGHQLRVDTSLGGTVRYVRDRMSSPIDLGILEVTGMAVVLVEQTGGGDPHGSLYIGPGTYRIRRQWEAMQGPYLPGLIKSKVRRLRRRLKGTQR